VPKYRQSIQHYSKRNREEGRIRINKTKKDAYTAKRRKEEGGKKQREEDKISAIVCQKLADISSRILMVRAVSLSARCTALGGSEWDPLATLS